MKSQFIIKRFMKKKAVRVYVIMKDKRIKHYWVIPEVDGTITIGNLSFIINPDDLLVKDNIPTLVYNTDNAESLNLMTEKKSYFDADRFNIAINSHVARDIFDSSKKSAINMDTVMIIASVFIASAIVGYLLMEKINAINDTLALLGIGG